MMGTAAAAAAKPREGDGVGHHAVCRRAFSFIRSVYSDVGRLIN
jgi:hypothetical protein